MKQNFRVFIQEGSNGMLIGEIPAIRACYAQGKNEKQLFERLAECANLGLKVMRKLDPKGFKNIQDNRTIKVELEAVT